MGEIKQTIRGWRMMMNVRFIDTSILLNLLGVPGKCQNREAVTAEFREIVDKGEVLILPLATIIETGNHISRIAKGDERYRVSKLFKEYLIHTAQDNAPWKFYQKGWKKENIMHLAESFEEYALQKISLGDLSIIYTYEQYKKETPAVGSIMIWSTDCHLCGYKDTNGLVDRRRMPAGS